MQQLKRVGWQIGQPLLPIHLVAQEDSLLSHLNFCIQNLGVPYYGIGNLQWDDTLLSQGVVSISKMTIVFPSGEIIDVPENGKISSYDLNLAGLNQVSIWVHLLKQSSEQEFFGESLEEEEKVIFSINQLVLTNEHHRYDAKVSLKLAEFERDVENRWKLVETYTPPLFTIIAHPFLTTKLSSIRSIVEHFQRELELEATSGKLFEQRTLHTKFCLIEIAKLRQFFLNMDRNVVTHPYYLYLQLTQFLSTVALLYMDKPDLSIIPYQHEKLGLLFSKLADILINYLKPKSEKLSSIQFEKHSNCYVSERMPQDLHDANEIYFVLQAVDPKAKFKIEGLKLAGYSRLYSVHRFALTGVILLRLESAPFNNSFSRSAHIYKVERDSEWDTALDEGKLAFSFQNENSDLQAFLYWK